jgi:hypothetical protein
MDNSGFNAWVLMGDEMHYIRVILVVTILIGDGKNGNTLVLHFGGKYCLGRVSRLCLTPFGCLSDPTRLCPLIKASMLQSLYVKLANGPKPHPPTVKGIQECTLGHIHLLG